MRSAPPIPDGFLRHPAHFVALGFGSGLARHAPGTWGTLAALPVYVLALRHLEPWAYLLVLVAGFAVGVWLCQRTVDALRVHDHPAIVWDEFIGLWITLALCPAHWAWWLLGFALFRLFDIAKPWPVSWLDRKVKGGFGVMVDDALAGVWAFLVLQAAVWLWG